MPRQHFITRLTAFAKRLERSIDITRGQVDAAPTKPALCVACLIEACTPLFAPGIKPEMLLHPITPDQELLSINKLQQATSDSRPRRTAGRHLQRLEPSSSGGEVDTKKDFRGEQVRDAATRPPIATNLITSTTRVINTNALSHFPIAAKSKINK